MVDVKGIDRMELLEAVWEHSRPVFHFMQDANFDREKASRQLDGNGYAKYICDRWIDLHVMVEGDLMYPTMHDRIYGEGSLQRTVSSLRDRKGRGCG